MGCWLCFGPRKEQQKMQNQEVKDLSDLKCKDEISLEKPSEPQNIAQDSQNKAQTFTYRELATATNNFRRESMIGQGGFGAVYMGKLDTFDQIVAVKQLDHGGLQGEKEFLVEVLMLSLLRHENLVNLVGYCAEGDQRLLVYEYLPFGSLENHLHDLRPDRQPLSWSTRMMIAAGAARGLEYLHNQADPPVIYRDLKTSNILLDRGFQPKLSDFGLAKFGPTGDKSHISTRVMGTQGYCAPEYAESGKLTMKSDIYSFGVVLLELITGRRPVDGTFSGSKRCLIDWARPLFKDQKNVMQLADPAMGTSISQSSLRKALEVAFICLQRDANSRPVIGDIVRALDYIVSQNCKNKEMKTEEMEEEAETLQSPEKETTLNILNSEGVDRDKAVAEAKMWGETWREIKRQNAEPGSDRTQTHSDKNVLG